MKILLLKGSRLLYSPSALTFMQIAVLVLLWWALPKFLHNLDPFAALVDPGIWQLVLLGLISFIGVCLLCWYILVKFWQKMGLPAIGHMVSQFKNLSLCIQFAFYWASFALLMLVATGCLMAIC